MKSAFERYASIEGKMRAEEVRIEASGKVITGYRIKGRLVQVFNEIDTDLYDWFETGVTKKPMLLSVTSHHIDGTISMKKTPGNGISKSHINRSFRDAPSAVIMNSCGSGGNTAVDLLRRLNTQGMQTIIAVSKPVKADVAGDFVSCFVQTAEKMGKGGVAIGDVFYKTLRCLSKSKNGSYGSLVLSYNLLGNGYLKLCLPENNL